MSIEIQLLSFEAVRRLVPKSQFLQRRRRQAIVKFTLNPARERGCSLARQPEGKQMMKVFAIACVAVPAMVVSASAQQPAIKRTILHSVDYPAGYTTVTAIVEVAPGACSGRHTHPGIDSGYVIQGDFVLKIDGKPEQTLKAGDSFETAPGTPHDGCSVSGNKLIDTWVIERGKPLASPAP